MEINYIFHGLLIQLIVHLGLWEKVISKLPEKYESDYPEKSTAAMDAVEAAVVRMMTKEEIHVPTIRKISQKSGYSVGTIYNYFKNIDGIFVYVFLRKQKLVLNRLINVIDSHPADKNSEILIESIFEGFFRETENLKPVLVRFFVRHFFKTASSPERFNIAIDVLIPPLIQARVRDTTGTFAIIEAEELRLLLRGMQAIVRAPLFEQNPFFGTKEHKRLAKEVCMRLFLKRS